MYFPTIKYDSPVVNAQWLLGAFEAQSPTTIVSEPDGNRWGANQVVLGVRGTDRIVADLYGGKGDVLKLRVGTNFGSNSLA